MEPTLELVLLLLQPCKYLPLRTRAQGDQAGWQGDQAGWQGEIIVYVPVQSRGAYHDCGV